MTLAPTESEPDTSISRLGHMQFIPSAAPTHPDCQLQPPIVHACSTTHDMVVTLPQRMLVRTGARAGPPWSQTEIVMSVHNVPSRRTPQSMEDG